MIRTADSVLARYGGLGAYGRDTQASHAILEGELDQNRVTGTFVPVVFLAVAGVLLNLVLGRLIVTQRSKIAVLQAFGYRNREVGLHYLLFALTPVMLGLALGVGGGMWLGERCLLMYGQYFNCPVLQYHLSFSLLFLAFAASAVAAVVGAFGAVRHAISLPPAEAMRAEPPRRFKPGFIERAGVGSLLGSVGLRGSAMVTSPRRWPGCCFGGPSQHRKR